MNSTKIIRILEFTWLIIGIVGIIAGVYKISKDGWAEGIYFLAFTLVAGIMYTLRRRQRKGFERDQKADRP
jgi:hypothetical protein